MKKGLREVGQTFLNVVKVPRAHWGLNLSYLFEGAAYFGILTELMLYFQENLEIHPHHAGLVVGFFTCFITLFQLFLGGTADKIGVRRAMRLALLLLIAGRVLLALGGHLFGTVGMGSSLFFISIGALLLVAIGYGMYQPAAYAAVRQFTDEKGAAMGYAMIYGLMNLGAFIIIGLAGPYIREATQEALPPNGITAVFWVCAGAVVVALFLVLTLMTKKQVYQATKRLAGGKGEEESQPAEEKPASTIGTLWDAPFVFLTVVAVVGLVFLLDFVVDRPLEKIFSFTGTGIPALDLFVRVSVFVVLLLPALTLFLKRRPAHPFRNGRFVFFIFILIPVQTLFAHNWMTLPQYIKYAYTGFVSEKYELISNLNPLLIFLFAPLVAAVTARANVYRMMILGTLIMASPTFLLAIAPHPALLYAYIFLMTIGEAMWQPRFLQYIAEVAPPGQTGIYMGIGQFPWFLTKMITGFYAGWFLSNYCPQTGAQNTEMMWLIYSLIAMMTPICLWIFRGWAGAGKGLGRR